MQIFHKTGLYRDLYRPTGLIHIFGPRHILKDKLATVKTPVLLDTHVTKRKVSPSKQNEICAVYLTNSESVCIKINCKTEDINIMSKYRIALLINCFISVLFFQLLPNVKWRCFISTIILRSLVYAVSTRFSHPGP
jgi:hypothetical protein